VDVSQAGGEVTVDVVLDDAASTGRGRLTVLRLAWTAEDPLAVVLRLEAQPDHPALPRGEWVVLRDFLRYGLEEPTGDGSVRIRPTGDRVELQLERYGRPAVVSVPREVLRDFLDDTEQQVPCGAERSDDAVEALLLRLLARD
jgi:Streptomyces sporulation and cell division protein, SsgA